MSTLVAALDNFTPKQLGENMHCEHGWSHDLKEEIVQIFFQLTRTSDKSIMENLAARFQSLISRCASTSVSRDAQLIWTLQRLAAQTRDLVDGKGEYRLGWYLINAFDKAGQNDTARRLIYYSVHPLPVDKITEFTGKTLEAHPYGSWKDIKYLWSQFDWSQETSDFMINLVNTQLSSDLNAVQSKEGTPTLCGRWVPRESSQFRKMFRVLAQNYFADWIDVARNAGISEEGRYSSINSRVEAAKRKAYREYRGIISTLNKALKTPQVNMCGKSWADIDYDKDVTSVTLSRSSKAFRNKDKKGQQRSEDPDRIQAALNYENWLASKVSKGETVKGARVGLNDLVSQALQNSYNSTDVSEKNRLNLQWKDGADKIGQLGNIVAMCDTSGSMDGDPMNAAIGLALRVAEKSALGKRVMSFSATPRWQILPEDDDFVRDCLAIRGIDDWGMNTNFTAALKLILDSCVAAKLSNDQVGDIVLAVFSDMQIDSQGNESLTQSMWDHIQSLYAANGYTKVPHILFWNLRSTSGFPVMSTQLNATMFSGFSPALLNIFCEKGMDGIRECTPFSQMTELLDNARYSMFSPSFHE